MRKFRAFNMVEIMIVVCLMTTTVILCIPTIFNNSKQARIISLWKKSFGEMQSNFEVYNASDYETIQNICKSNQVDNQEEFFNVIGPYLNVDTSKNTKKLKSYRYKFKNGAQIPLKSIFFTKTFAFQENENIVAFKWITCDCDENIPCATALFDLNGMKKPNQLGKDIFGIYIYKNGIKSYGSELTNKELEKDCNSHTSGASCSEYYLRGGRF